MSSKNFYGLTGDVTIDGGILNVANTNVSGNVTSTSLFVSNVATLGTTKTFVVTVDNSKYVIDGVSQASLELHEGQTYIFDLSHSSLASGPHPLEFATQPEGANSSGYTTGISSTGTLGTTGAKKTFVVSAGAPTILYYYCTQHTGMGGQINISSAAELVVSGRIVASGNVEASKITASANVEVTGNVVASKFVGDGSLLTNVTGATTSGLQVVTDNSPTTTNTIQFTNPTTSLTASSNIVATGNVTADHFIGDGSRLSGIVTSLTLEEVVNTANTTSNTVQFTNTSTSLTASGNVEVAGNVVVSGNVEAAYFVGDGSKLSGIVTSVTLEDAVNAANTTSNTVQFTNTSTSLTASGNVEVSGNVIAGYFIGDGSRLTGISGGSGGTSHWTKDAVTNQLHYSTGSVGISNTNPAHDLSVGSNLYIDDDATDGVLMVTGNVHGTYFVGDGSRLINLPEGGGSTNWTTSGNPVNKIYYPQNPGTTSVSVGIMNAAPAHTLSVGSNLFVDDAGSNVLVVDGNITAESMFLGALGIKPAYPLDSVTDTGNVTPHTISFTNPTLGITTASNVEIGGALVVGKGTLGGSNLEVGEANLFVNTDLTRVGIATDQPAATLHVNGSLAVDGPLTFGTVDVAAQHGLEAITAVDNTTPLTIELQNADTSLVTTGNVEVGGNVITSKDLTVSGNVEVGRELTVSGGIVSNVNLLSVSNVASIKNDSNVVTEFPRSKKLIKYPRVALTADAQTNSGYQGHFVTRSTQFLDYNAWEVFDNNNPVGGNSGQPAGWASAGPGAETNTYSHTTGAVTAQAATHPDGLIQGEWIQIQLPDSIYLHDIKIHSRAEAYYTDDTTGFPKNVYLYGKNSNDWILIKEFTTSSKKYGDSYTEYIDYTKEAFTHFVLVVNSIHVSNQPNSSDPGFTTIGQIELFGVPEYDPEAYGTDVTIKSKANVPNTDWLEVYYDAKNYSGIGDVQDETANDIDATIGAATTFDSVNKAWSFSGTSNRDGNEFVSGFLPSDFEGNQIHSVSMWLKFDYWHDGAFCIIGKVDRLNSDNHKAIHFQFQDTSSASPRILYDFWDNQKSFYLPDDVQPGRWLHMTATYTGNAAIRKMFVNGQELTAFTTNSNYATALALDTTNLVVRLGSRFPVNSSYIFHGDIANFRLFNRPLTSDEIWQLYAYQKEDFGHGDLGMTLKAGRLGIGTSEPRAALDVRGDIYRNGDPAFPIPTAHFYKQSSSITSTSHYANIRDGWVALTHAPVTVPGVIEEYSLAGADYTTDGGNSGLVVKLCKEGLYKIEFNCSISTQSGINSHIGVYIRPVYTSYISENTGTNYIGLGQSNGYDVIQGTGSNNAHLFHHHEIIRVTKAPGYAFVTMTPNSNNSGHFRFENYGSTPYAVMNVMYLG